MIQKFFKQNWLYFALLLLLFACNVLRVYTYHSFIGSHLSNAVISGSLLLLLTGPDEFRRFTKWFKIVAVSLLIINVALELGPAIGTIGNDKVAFLDFNTPDPWDMVFGVVAVLGISRVSYIQNRNNKGA